MFYFKGVLKPLQLKCLLLLSNTTTSLWQCVWSTAACLIISKHITSILRPPMQQRVVYKLAILIHKVLHGLSQYLAPSLPHYYRLPMTVMQCRCMWGSKNSHIEHSLLQDHICRITYLSTYVMLEFPPAAEEDTPVLLTTVASSDYCF